MRQTLFEFGSYGLVTSVIIKVAGSSIMHPDFMVFHLHPWYVSCGINAGFQEQEVTGKVEAAVLMRSSRSLAGNFSKQVGNMAHISTLSLDLLKNIAFRLLPDHIKTYFHFRAVCRDWRSCTPGPQDLAFCFRPLNWVMVPQNVTSSNSTTTRHFSHLPTGRGAVLSLPELRTHSILTDSDGFLLLIDKKTKAMRLYNPFNRYLSKDLPPILKNVKDVAAASCSVNFITLISPSTSSPGRPTVMLSFGMADGAAFANPGDNSWSFLKLPFYISGALLLKGRFYFVDSCGSIWAVEPEHKLLTCVIRQDVCTRSWDIVKLGRNNILLLEWGLVDKQRSRVAGPLPRLKIFIIDLDYKVLIPLSSIGENAIFVDQNKQTFLVPSKHPFIKGDSIYFWSNRFQSIVYDLERKTIECSGLELANIRREISSLLYYGPINIDLHIFNYRKYRLCSKYLKVLGNVLRKWERDRWNQASSS